MLLAALLPFAGTHELIVWPATIRQSPNILLPRHLSIVNHLWVGLGYPVGLVSLFFMSAASIFGVSV